MKQIDMNNETVIYQSEDGKTQQDVKLYASEDLYKSSTCSILKHMDNDGKQRAEALSVMP